MLRQRFDPSTHVCPQLSRQRTFSDPAIFSIVGSDQDYQIIPNSIVGVQEVRDDADQPQSAGEHDELTIGSKLGEEVFWISLCSAKKKTPSSYPADTPR